MILILIIGWLPKECYKLSLDLLPSFLNLPFSFPLGLPNSSFSFSLGLLPNYSFSFLNLSFSPSFSILSPSFSLVDLKTLNKCLIFRFCFVSPGFGHFEPKSLNFRFMFGLFSLYILF